ncbi:MAG: UDP-glucose 6-dehydrogenase, partial [Acidovorax sp.]
PSLTVIHDLLQRGAEVCAYDPVAIAQARKTLGDRPGLHFADSANAALDGATALIIATEWKEFRSPDFDLIAATLRAPVIFDGRNLFEPAEMKALGLEYHPIGRAVL